MAIVSISLNDAMLSEVDALRRELGYSGRSDVVRAGLRTLLAENNESKRLRGAVNSVMLIVHDKESEASLTRETHAFGGIITTHVHNCLRDGTCLETFVLRGDAGAVRRFLNAARALKGVRYAKLVTP